MLGSLFISSLYGFRSHRPNEASIFDLDLRWAVSHFEKAPPVFPDYEKQVKVITSFPEALNLLSTIRDQAEITYDYETNCLKPYTSGAKILVVGVAFNEKAYSFPLYIWPDAQQDTFKEHWINILLNRKIKKVAHNIQFEELWNRVHLRIEKSQGWCADTMVTAHILDAERTHFCSLKTQAFVNFGVIGYEKDIKPLIPKKGMNSLDSLPPEKLGLYCGLDALFTHLLKKKQDIKIKNAGKEDINKVYLDGIGSMIDMTQEGMDVDQKFMFREKMRLATQITTGFNALMVDPIIKKFRDQFGRDPAIEMASDKLKIGSEDLKRIVYDVMKIPVTKTTAKAGKPSLDEEVLEGINHPFTKQIIFIRQRLKMKDTYLGQFERCAHEGKIHPTFNLHIARSGRSSSEDPNSQNFPARNEEAMNTVRGCLSAPPGWRIGEADHSGFEVRVIGVYSQDSVLINYIKDESTDMHRDCAEGLLFLPRDQITKDIRQIGKNGYVFPSFYGSYYVATARDIWKQLMYVKKSKEIFAHLKGKGIRNLQDFTNHVEQYERSFWKKFNGVKIWQEKTIKTYLRTGRIKYLTGFDRCGLLSNNQLLNTAIQGTAFQCLLWAIPRIAHRMRQEKMQSRIRGQIHDSILFLVKPGEEKQLQKIVLSIACKEIREYWSWLNIPLDMDFKFSEVGGSWAAMKKLDF
jgi:DNA polymerase-1